MSHFRRWKEIGSYQRIETIEATSRYCKVFLISGPSDVFWKTVPKAKKEIFQTCILTISFGVLKALCLDVTYLSNIEILFKNICLFHKRS